MGAVLIAIFALPLAACVLLFVGGALTSRRGGLAWERWKAAAGWVSAGATLLAFVLALVALLAYRADGEILATGESQPWHVACAGFTVKAIIERFAEYDGVNEDDVFLLNDPYVSAIHQSDVYIVSPIHFEGRLVGWGASFVHVMDIGAMSPGGDSPEAREICHEASLFNILVA